MKNNKEPCLDQAKQGRIHGNPVANGGAGDPNSLRIYECDQPTYRPTRQGQGVVSAIRKRLTC